MTADAAVEVEDLGPCKKKLVISVPSERIREVFAGDLEELVKNATIPGFRQGRAPKALIEKRFRKNLDEQVKEKLLDEAFKEALDQKDLKAMLPPEIGKVDFDPDGKLDFDVTVTVRPKVEIENYKGIELVKETKVVTDKDIDDFIEALRMRLARFETVSEGAVEFDDIVSIEAKILVDGTEVFADRNLRIRVAESTDELYGLKIEGLGKALDGLVIGDERRFDVTLPDDFFLDQHKGQNATLVVSASEISRRVIPELDEDFMSRLGFDNEQDLRQYARRAVAERNEYETNRRMRADLTEKLLAMCSFDLPESVVESSAQRLQRLREHEMRIYGATPEQISETADRVQSASLEQATAELKTYFILDAIADNEKIFATETEVSEAVERMAARRGVRPARQWHDLEQQDSLAELRDEIRHTKTVRFLLDNANIIEKGAVTAEGDAAEQQEDDPDARDKASEAPEGGEDAVEADEGRSLGGAESDQ